MRKMNVSEKFSSFNPQIILLVLWLTLPSLFFTGCDLLTDTDDEEKNETLYVKFMNDSNSVYIISNIQLLPMGVAGEESEPEGSWSENILTDGKTIAPGEHEFFNLPIKNMHWCTYRLGVQNGNGNDILLHEQEHTELVGEPPITHWGSDQRTVSVTVSHDESSDLIYISAWSDFAGIEE